MVLLPDMILFSYVGILHDINSEKHTVALEQVVSHGTEGRRGDPTKEIAGSDNVYEYIVFRGGDVKDLRIEEAAQKPKPPPQVLDDPAILGVSHFHKLFSQCEVVPVHGCTSMRISYFGSIAADFS